ncbi:MAG: HAD-IIIC family phosphatase [Eubacteriales bacterium]|nr:HAD-IIIC family phosphatase [Eubacteriales bacterium]
MDFNTLKKRASKTDPDLPKYKLAILGDCATQHIATALRGTADLHGFTLDIFDSDYNQIFEQIIDDQSELYQFSPQSILLILCAEKLEASFMCLPERERVSFADNTIKTIQQYWSVISAKTSASVLQFNFAYYNDGVTGSFTLREPASFAYQLQKLNYLLSEAAVKHKNVLLVDVNGIQSLYGRNVFRDSKLYYLAKMPFSLEALPIIAQRTVDVLEALRGHEKKCVVLDLDNTLWGGAIGDDGIEGIQVGELGTGHAFTDFQLWLRELKKRGILLAVCSKNNEDTAREPFEKHPDMVLRMDDFAMFIANWEDKASNIIRIQQTLNIGMDSMVFLDDNPFEREQVRSAIREISVPDLPEDPALYLDILQSLNLFETVSYSSADNQRTEQYQQEAQRAVMKATYSSYDEYLESLDMHAVSAPFDKFYFPRIAQLTQRSNQFNLRTVRYTEGQIQEIADDTTHITRYYSLRDKIGDYGLIGVVILDKLPDNNLFISELLMSCRVLKRGMEEFIINNIIKMAEENGSSRVFAEYIETPKNGMVAEFYQRMGFAKVGTKFYADISTFKTCKTSIKEENYDHK